jgi:hypothetical protein
MVADAGDNSVVVVGARDVAAFARHLARHGSSCFA